MISSFLQSSEWQKLQESLERETLRIQEELVVLHQLRFGKQYAYMPRGPKSFSESSLKDIAVMIKEKTQNTVFLRVEPMKEYSREDAEKLRSAGFRKIEAVQPEETLFLDLRKGEDELLSGMKHNTRYAIRAAERREVKIQCYETGEEKKKHFGEFWKLFEETNKHHDLDAYGKRYYEAVAGLEGECRSELFVAYVGEKPISAALVLYYRKMATYLFAASAQGFGKYNAPSLLLWRIIKKAQKRGEEALDLWGASDTKKEWAGLTAFKKGFGGAPVKFLGTWDYVFGKTWYLVYKVAKKISP